MTNEHIEILFTCRACGLNKAKARVRLRAANEDILHWMDSVTQAAGDMHVILSPLCRERKVDLVIPISKDTKKNQGIGHAPATVNSDEVTKL